MVADKIMTIAIDITLICPASFLEIFLLNLLRASDFIPIGIPIHNKKNIALDFLYKVQQSKVAIRNIATTNAPVKLG